MNDMNQDTVTSLDETAVATATAASFDELSAGSVTGNDAPMETLMDVTLPVVIEFGRTKMAVQDVLGLGTGSVIQLEQAVGEPVQIYVGDQRLAEGEVVVIGEFFGVRITRVVGNQGNRSATR